MGLLYILCGAQVASRESHTGPMWALCGLPVGLMWVLSVPPMGPVWVLCGCHVDHVWARVGLM